MQLRQLAARIAGLLPRTPGEFQAAVRHGIQVLAEEPSMRWSFLAVVLAGLALAVTRRRGTSALAALALVGASLVWFPVNQVREGVILLPVAPTHGLTEADLVVPAVTLLALAGRLLLACARRIGRRGGRAHRLGTVSVG